VEFTRLFGNSLLRQVREDRRLGKDVAGVVVERVGAVAGIEGDSAAMLNVSPLPSPVSESTPAVKSTRIAGAMRDSRASMRETERRFIARVKEDEALPVGRRCRDRLLRLIRDLLKSFFE
jgi:hypothetical protein